MFLLVEPCYAKKPVIQMFVQRSSMFVMCQDDGFGNIVDRAGITHMWVEDMVVEDLH